MAGPVLSMLRKNYGTMETSRLVHELTRNLIKTAVQDLLVETGKRLAEINPDNADDVRHAGFPIVGFSEKIGADLEELRGFLFASVWRHYKVNRMTSKAKRVMRQLYDLFMKEPNTLPDDWQSLDGEPVADLSQERKARHIADYVASMTDRYAMLEYERLFDLGPILR